MNNESNKSFGFKQVTSKKKRTLIDGIFSDVASQYDITNDLMSFGVHRLWKEKLCQMIQNFDSKILDVASGTGDISFRIKKHGRKLGKDPAIVACDINYDMLKICQQKAMDTNCLDKLNLVVCDAENLPFADNSLDYYVIAFGIRNMVCIENTLKEAYRVLKPTGKFLCLEFSKVQNESLKPLYDLYSFKLIPEIGKVTTANKEAYKYLAESISVFPEQEEFKQKIQNAGFSDVNYENLTFGIAAIHYGFKI